MRLLNHAINHDVMSLRGEPSGSLFLCLLNCELNMNCQASSIRRYAKYISMLNVSDEILLND